MDDPFASLTSGYIHRPSMKDAKKQQQLQQQQQQAKVPVRPPVWSQAASGGTWNGSPQRVASPVPMSSNHPPGNRYPSPSAKKPSMEGAQPMKHAGSTGSLDTLSNLSWNSSSASHKSSSMGGAMNAMGKGIAMSEQPMNSGATAKQSPPPAAPAPAVVSSDDFDKLFGSVGGKPDAGTVGVDVFGGDFPPPSAADPFDMFGDIGGSAISHVQPPASPPPPATAGTDELIPGFGTEPAAPPMYPASPNEESSNDNSFSDLAHGDSASPPPPDYHTATIQAAPSQSASTYEPPPPAYEEVADSSSGGGGAASTASGTQQQDSYEEAMQRARMPQHPSGQSDLARHSSSGSEKKGHGASSLFSKLGKEGNKIGGLLMKHGAKAATQATKAVKQGMNQVREVVNENLHGASGAWTFNDDGMLEATGSPTSTSAVHIQMADTLLGVDPATRGAMLGAMEPADREAVEAILNRLGTSGQLNSSPPPGRSVEKPQPAAPAGAETSPVPSQPSTQGREPSSPPASNPLAAPAHATTAQPPSPPAASPEQSPTEDTVDFLFSDTPPSSNMPVTPAPTPTGLEDLFTSAPSATSHPDSMFGNIFGDDTQSDVSGVATRVTVTAESHESDTAERAELRARRAKRVQDRIDQQLREKLERDRAEEEQRDEQAELKASIQDSLVAWKKNANGNVVALLASLQTVLWEDSGWQPIGMGDLLSDVGVKKAWRKANLLVHPDKVKQKGGDMGTLVRADMIFDTLKEAYSNYKPMGC